LYNSCYNLKLYYFKHILFKALSSWGVYT
jgi:hypothetical protein